MDTMGHSAIRYLHQGYPREEMVALFLAADVMLVTALRDGMNLVAKEYVATRTDNRGVLVLSEFAGASDELGSAIRINPHDIEGLKDVDHAGHRDARRRAGPPHARPPPPRDGARRRRVVARLPEALERARRDDAKTEARR